MGSRGPDVNSQRRNQSPCELESTPKRSTRGRKINKVALVFGEKKITSGQKGRLLPIYILSSPRQSANFTRTVRGDGGEKLSLRFRLRQRLRTRPRLLVRS